MSGRISRRGPFGPREAFLACASRCPPPAPGEIPPFIRVLRREVEVLREMERVAVLPRTRARWAAQAEEAAKGVALMAELN